MKDNLFWFIAFILGIPIMIWKAIKLLFGKDDTNE